MIINGIEYDVAVGVTLAGDTMVTFRDAHNSPTFEVTVYGDGLGGLDADAWSYDGQRQDWVWVDYDHSDGAFVAAAAEFFR